MQGQKWNKEAISQFWSYFKNRAFLIPHQVVTDVTLISFINLKNSGYKYVIFDKDNTLTAPYSEEFYSDSIKEKCDEAIQIFGEKNVAIFSNTLGFGNNHQKLFKNIPIIQHKIQKPGGIEEVIHHFSSNSDQKTLDVQTKEIICVGDRVLTDVYFGNKYDMYTIYTNPLTKRGENNVVRCVSFLY